MGTAVNVPEYKTRKALMRGRYDIFVESGSSYVHNVFDLNSEIETSPLLGLRILQALKDAVILSGDSRSTYMAKNDLYGYLMTMGFERRAVTLWLDSLLKKTLVINYDPTCTEAENATQLEISPAGDIHLYWASGNYDYLEAMAEITVIFNREAYDAIKNASLGQGQKRMKEIIQVFVEYITSEDRRYCQVSDHESYLGQQKIFSKMLNFLG